MFLAFVVYRATSSSKEYFSTDVNSRIGSQYKNTLPCFEVNLMEACNYGEMRDDMLRDHVFVSVTSTTMTHAISV